MYTKKDIKKIVQEFDKINKYSKAIIKYGTQISLGLLLIGTIILVSNNRLIPYDSYLRLIGIEISKASFAILAQAVIGGLVLDYVNRRR
ncbi:MAG TPA: hypothetical protein DCE02_00255 [Ruminiclostridium sp.]|jgi:hypothetical protein|uniref:Uncharacterized protein n=1 Tax=Acetivibrio saccincola TaxID=1677857 RepID=A0A2K9EIM5_9FIRM|nr:hypothetical protein [Acetivibrio saccincola]HAA42426.1 hypothetical protein [Ruminiclostridium sp.]AUG57793.1 hypothetical protein HVS_09455 [Acetivibrio saccincola]NLW25837.1 hypothetical protein [Acetivibrio saccincola]PQQ67678.1 hypothetical protein B9R14_13585 [Acetivibrio saccincola]HOA97020.1 hypothetical protein [Acetivibrio saccincola]